MTKSHCMCLNYKCPWTQQCYLINDLAKLRNTRLFITTLFIKINDWKQLDCSNRYIYTKEYSSDMKWEP